MGWLPAAALAAWFMGGSNAKTASEGGLREFWGKRGLQVSAPSGGDQRGHGRRDCRPLRGRLA
jgi:hypothetical protein